MATEIELKLSIAPADIEIFLQHPLLQSKHETLLLSNTYFDTEEHDLLKRGVGLRVRSIGDKRVQTLKTAGVVVGGLHTRQEWENEISGETPVYHQFPEGALPNWCAQQKNRDQILPIFTTGFIRMLWLLHTKAGDIIELVLDQGTIQSKKAYLPLYEIELELKSGTPAALYQMAITLQETQALFIENKSKAQRGYELHKPALLSTEKAETSPQALTAEYAALMQKNLDKNP